MTTLNNGLMFLPKLDEGHPKKDTDILGRRGVNDELLQVLPALAHNAVTFWLEIA